ATPGRICLPENVAREVASKLKLKAIDRGRLELKNVPYPVHAFEIDPSQSAEGQERAIDPKHRDEARNMVLSLSSTAEWGPRPAIVSNPRVVFHLAPFIAFSRSALDVQLVKQMMPSLAPTNLVASASDLDESEWWNRGKGLVVPGKPNQETIWYARFIRPGVFEVALNLGTRLHDDPRVQINGYKVEAAIVDMFDKCSTAALKIGLSGPGIASAVLVGVDNVDVHMSRLAGRFRKPFVGLGEYAVKEIGEPLGNYLQPMFDRLWTAAGIGEGSISYREGGWAGYRGDRAYEL
ncbi:MAG TPA: hypothetical protein VMI56_13460, partial [Reyranella sp.]|nr:hypothetical protein [Reyranella sp.]